MRTPEPRRVLPSWLLVAGLLVLGASARPAQAAVDTAPWARVLKAGVKGRYVDYAAVEKHRPELQAFLKAVATADVKKLGKADRMAFYTNAYNAIVLEQVLVHKRPKSVLDVKGFFDAIPHTVAGESLTLNQLEETKLRREGDPRVHFVVNCASDDCPPLAPFVYTGAAWDKQLEGQTAAYLTRAGEVVVDDEKKTVQVVQLFEWYQGDWGSEEKARAFLARYLPRLAAKVKDPAYKLTYRPYDWDLNRTR